MPRRRRFSGFQRGSKHMVYTRQSSRLRIARILTIALLPRPLDRYFSSPYISTSPLAPWAVPYSWVKVWRSHGRIVDEIAGYSWEPRQETLTTADRRSAVSSVQVEDNFFSVFGVQARLGRTFQPKDSQDCPNCVVLSYSTWQHWFLGNKKIVGQKIHLNDTEAVVLGVLPERFWFPSRDVCIWRVLDGGLPGPKANVGVAARLRQDVGEREAESLLERLVTENTGNLLLGFDVEIWGVQERIREPFLLYMFSLGIVLLVTSAYVWSGRMHVGSLRAGRVVARRSR